MTMPSDDQKFEETILRGNITVDGGDAVTNTGNQSPDCSSVPESTSSSSSVMKSNLSSINKHTQQQHHVTFSESHSIKVVEDTGDEDKPVIYNNIRAITDTNELHNHTAADHDTSWEGGGGGGIHWGDLSSLQMEKQPLLELQSKNPPHPIIRLNRSPSTDSHENPFQSDGPLSKKADYIVRNSTISRTELKIADPDQSKAAEEAAVVEEQVVQSQSAPSQHASPPSGGSDIPDGPTRPNDINVKENGKLDEPLTPQSVEVEVGQANASQPEAEKAEEVNVPKDKKCKCCVVQ